MGWIERAKRKPFAHQVVGVERMTKLTEPEIGRVLPGCFYLADEMRLGKTKQVIDTAQRLFVQGDLETVIVVAPASVRGVWFDKDLGEIAKHRWDGLPLLVTDYHSNVRKWFDLKDKNSPYLTWIITNYEYIRFGLTREGTGWNGPNLDPLLKLVKIGGGRTLLVLDESAALATATSLQTRAVLALRKRCARVTLLNGTPIVEDPESLFSQIKIMDERIFGTKYVTQYRHRYAVMGGYTIQRYGRKIPTEVIGWRHEKRPGCCHIPEHIKSPVHAPGPGLEEIQAKLAPYILRRERKDCFDTPPKLDSVTLTATLKSDTWRHYKEMRDDLVSWLDTNRVATSAQAGVRVMRLSQLTSGFLAGLRDEGGECPECLGSGVPSDAALDSGQNCHACAGSGTVSLAIPPVEVGREKLDLFLNWVKQRITEDPGMRMITWCRFRAELNRVVLELGEIGGLTSRAIHGGQTRQERENGLLLMHPSNKYEGPAILAGTVGTGGLGINMAGAHEVVYQSNDPSLYKRKQSEDRPQGIEQTQSVSYHDIVAVGPSGQKTIDHVILAALQSKSDLANWTVDAWKTALTEIE